MASHKAGTTPKGFTYKCFTLIDSLGVCRQAGRASYKRVERRVSHCHGAGYIASTFHFAYSNETRGDYCAPSSSSKKCTRDRDRKAAMIGDSARENINNLRASPLTGSCDVLPGFHTMSQSCVTSHRIKNIPLIRK